MEGSCRTINGGISLKILQRSMVGSHIGRRRTGYSLLLIILLNVFLRNKLIVKKSYNLKGYFIGPIFNLVVFTNQVKAEGFRKMYPKFDRFMDIRKQLDPTGMFLNDYWLRVFGDETSRVVAPDTQRL